MNEIVAPQDGEALSDVVQLRKIGNSVGIILSKDVLARFGLAEGDRFTVVRQPDREVKLVPYDDVHARGIRDQGMLESALDRPQNKFAYGERDLTALAAAYAFGIARNHPFIDGNKRAALAAMIVFFNLNGIDLLIPQADMTAAILAVAAGEAEEDVLAQWLRDHLAQPKRTR